MTKIALTQNEFNILVLDNHPDFDACSNRNIMIESDNCDIIYEREVIRKSDNKTFILSFIYNSGFGGYQDWIHDSNCDFVIDTNKKDIYDSRGSLIEEKKAVTKIEQRHSDVYEKMVQAGLITKEKTNRNWLNMTSDEFADLFLYTHEAFNPLSDVTIASASQEVFRLAVKYKINGDLLWGKTFQNKKLKHASRERIKKYFENEKKGTETKEKTVTVVINGKKVKISDDEFQAILALGKK